MNVQDAIANIEQRQAETRTFCAEMHKPAPMPWLFAISAMTLVRRPLARA